MSILNDTRIGIDLFALRKSEEGKDSTEGEFQLIARKEVIITFEDFEVRVVRKCAQSPLHLALRRTRLQVKLTRILNPCGTI